eukprot:TRINITY_DN18381_c0_g1_i1.p1 TRINITY_DN18381_c0_g1~~TRINITY_DN18381_c0_g1_i1.p1  ORF type:complete len:585 (+),score=72.17 TRINITY_DN18381_c0_g1_i1:61-1815(+)
MTFTPALRSLSCVGGFSIAGVTAFLFSCASTAAAEEYSAFAGMDSSIVDVIRHAANKWHIANATREAHGTSNASGTIALVSDTVDEIDVTTNLGGPQVEHSGNYSTNAICSPNNCVNPLFPGYANLVALEASTWQCEPYADVRKMFKFCDGVINYDVGVPSQSTATALVSVIQTQEAAAATAYFYHLSAMKMDAWEHRDVRGRQANPCAEAVRTMVCNTYLPKASAGCSKGGTTEFARPCKNVCTRYMEACSVECCDESSKCVFRHEVSFVSGSSQTREGYTDALGPSAMCTGAASRRATASRGLLIFASVFAPFSVGLSNTAAVGLVLAAVASVLQGCDVIPHHIAAWQAQPSYVADFQVSITGKPTIVAALNSCDQLGVPEAERCSGNGVCKPWNASSSISFPTHFCECFRNWADPECRTRRKSQAVAFALSVFLGPLGADRFYMGDFGAGFAKTATFGGFGIWWLYDIVRVGSAPVYTDRFRLAYDLHHIVYVICIVLIFTVLGHLYFGVWCSSVKKRRAKDDLMLAAEDAFVMSRSATLDVSAKDRVLGMPVRMTFGMPRPVRSFFSSGYGACGAGAFRG